MDVQSCIYDKVNGLQVRDGKELISWILRDRSGTTDVILDVGCGSGNVTKLLGESIPHNRLLALDIDPNMVKFAENNHSAGTIKYIVQDITQPWDNIHPKIRDLKGSVDLIFVNYVLHWFKDMDTTFENLYKLLKPGGAVYFTFPAHQLKHRALKLDSAEVQRSNTCKSLKGVGFHDVEVQLKEDHWEFNSPKDFQEMLKLFRNYYFRFRIPDILESDELRSELEALIFKAYSLPAGQDLPGKIDLEQCTVFYDTFWGRARKRNEKCKENEA